MSRKLNQPRRKLPDNVKYERVYAADGINASLKPARNSVIEEAGYFLHPTKGWRKKSAISSICENIAAEMRKGMPWKFKQIKQLVKNAR